MKPLIIGLLNKKENIVSGQNIFSHLHPPLPTCLLHPLPRHILLVCTTVLARRDKIVDYCQTEDLAAESNYQERRKKKEERGIINLVAIKKPQGQATV